jgi:hypothetical protein
VLPAFLFQVANLPGLKILDFPVQYCIFFGMKFESVVCASIFFKFETNPCLMNRFLFLLLLLTIDFCSAQKFSSVDFDSIKTVLQKDTTLYSRLVERVRRFDSTLTKDELRLAYYGQVFQRSYSPYGKGEDNDLFIEKYNSGEHLAAMPYGEKAIKANPLVIGNLYKLGVCYKIAGNELMKKRVMRIFTRLLDCIEQSGNGKSCETSFVVTSVADEYVVLGDYDLDYDSQSLTGNCDMFKVKKSEKFPYKKIYFNTYWSLKKMEELLKGN